MKLIQSPLNYTGGKYRLLPQLLPLFPKDIKTFVDLFCGGGNVGLNAECESVLFNDINSRVVNILSSFRRKYKEETFNFIFQQIDHYGLSLVSCHGYDYYHCNSQDGLGAFNRQPYLKMRTDFNAMTEQEAHYSMLLYVLIVYSFNNQIRFNRKGQFNLPVGKRDFNTDMQNKLSLTTDRLQELHCDFSSHDFLSFDPDSLRPDDFVYADPPYLITCATYNEQGGWDTEKEVALYKFLDELNDKHIRFALSNVLTGKGRTNTILQEWLDARPHYTCHHLNYRYTNSNYHLKDRTARSDEVLITNY